MNLKTLIDLSVLSLNSIADRAKAKPSFYSVGKELTVTFKLSHYKTDFDSFKSEYFELKSKSIRNDNGITYLIFTVIPNLDKLELKDKEALDIAHEKWTKGVEFDAAEYFNRFRVVKLNQHFLAGSSADEIKKDLKWMHDQYLNNANNDYAVFSIIEEFYGAIKSTAGDLDFGPGSLTLEFKSNAGY